MNLSRIDLNLFVVFDAIYTEGSLTRASEVLHLTQPAVSHALARLRDTLGDELFIRAKRGVSPTPLAQQLIVPVRESLQRLQTTLQVHREFEPQELQRVFRLSLRDIFEVMLLPALTAELAQQAPGVNLICMRVGRDALAHDLATGRIDLAAEVLITHDDSICHEKLQDDRLVCLIREHHPRQDSLTLEGYLELKHVLVSSRERGPGYEDIELSRHGLSRHIGLRTQHYYAAALVASQTDMVLTVPHRFARILQHNAPLQIREFPLPLAPMEVYLYWHRNLDSDPANRWLREKIKVLAK
ncbi:MAG: LysR family transcriptional regulator [Hahellaceae bacterium]|nr:LysR family transcriptional regulator [Hahellaceae bacterium]MCP5170085.1 LysR family transcriptional regulator [Hahellaceae bacterium]